MVSTVAVVSVMGSSVVGSVAVGRDSVVMVNRFDDPSVDNWSVVTVADMGHGDNLVFDDRRGFDVNINNSARVVVVHSSAPVPGLSVHPERVNHSGHHLFKIFK